MTQPTTEAATIDQTLLYFYDSGFNGDDSWGAILYKIAAIVLFPITAIGLLFRYCSHSETLETIRNGHIVNTNLEPNAPFVIDLSNCASEFEYEDDKMKAEDTLKEIMETYPPSQYCYRAYLDDMGPLIDVDDSSGTTQKTYDVFFHTQFLYNGPHLDDIIVFPRYFDTSAAFSVKNSEAYTFRSSNDCARPILAQLENHPCTGLLDVKALIRDNLFLHSQYTADLSEILLSRELPSNHQLSILRQLAKGLKSLHEMEQSQAWHGSISPDKILIRENGDDLEAALWDFSTCCDAEPDLIQSFVPPEFLLETELYNNDITEFFHKYGQKIDVWDMGMIFAQILLQTSNVEPIWKAAKDNNLQVLRLQTEEADELWDIIEGMLCLDPNKRLSASEVSDRLGRWE